MPKHINRFIIAIIATFILTIGSISTTYAHAGLVKTDPPDGTVLDSPPEVMNMWFNEPITGDFSSFRLLDINGQVFEFAKIVVDPTDAKHVTLYMPANMPDGVYSINWSAHSSVDGHITNGLVIMGIGANTELGTIDRTVEVPTPWFEAVLRWINFTLLTSFTGALVVIFFILRRAAKQDDLDTAVSAENRLLTTLQWGTAAAWVLGFALLLYQASTLLRNLPESVTLIEASWQIIANSRWGTLWLLRQMLLPLMAAFIFLARQKPQTKTANLGLSIATLISLTLLLLLSLNSHAAGIGQEANIAILVDWLHLTSVGVWLGSLISMAIALLPILRQQKAQFLPLAKATWGRFGTTAAFSVAAIILTGIYSSGKQLATFDTFLTTPYGRILSGKIALLLVMGAVGLLNAMLLHPKVARPLGWLLQKPKEWTPLPLSRLPKLVLIESGLGLLILMAAGLVTAMPNARGPQYVTQYNHVVDSMAQEVDDLLISLSAKPNLPGSNVISIRASSIRRPEPAPVLRVFANLTYLEEDLGTTTVETEKEAFNRTSLDELAAPVYRIGGTQFSLPGRWLVEVHVRREGMPDTVAQFEWTVLPSAEPPVPIVSGRPLSPITNTIAAVGGAFILLAIFTLLIRQLTNRTRGNRRGPSSTRLEQKMLHTKQQKAEPALIAVSQSLQNPPEKPSTHG